MAALTTFGGIAKSLQNRTNCSKGNCYINFKNQSKKPNGKLKWLIKKEKWLMENGKWKMNSGMK